MSAISQSLRFKFGNFFRHLFHRPAPGAAAETRGAAPGATPPAPEATASAEGLTLPLQAVLTALPAELQSRIRPVDIEQLNLVVPLERVLPELARGAVTVTFGEIRRTAPQVFATGVEHDAVSVALPLHEILARLNPALLARRPTQKKSLALPAELTSPFAGRGEGLFVGVVAPLPSSPASEVAKAPGGLPQPMSLAAPAASVASIPFAGPAAEPQERPAPAPPRAPANFTLPAPNRPPAQPDYLAPPPVARGIQPANHLNGRSSASNTGVLLAPLAAFVAGWPEPLRQEISLLLQLDARLAMPVEVIETALKRGRVVLPWRIVRAWIQPTAPPHPSPHDATEVELPLSVVAPLFLARQNGAGPASRVTVAETIPDLFFVGSPKADPAPLPPADNGAHQRNGAAAAARLADADSARRPAAAPELAAKSVTPNEVVARAAALEGVLGALFALPEGLLVAGRLPPEYNGDALAALLPQIFTTVSQSTKELRLGDLSQLDFTVGNVTLKLFRGHALYFAALGRAGGALPAAELSRLVAELDHHP